MRTFNSLFQSAVLLAALAVAGGCSTWRCRGFLDARDMPVEPFTGDYVIDSIEFRRLGPENVETCERSPHLTWLAAQDALVETTYLDDISRALGLTNQTERPVSVRLSIVPIDEVRLGRDTLFWPMTCTAGIFPAHLVDETPFDVIVRFVSKDDLGNDYSYSHASVGLVRTDYQCGLSRLDMDNPPDAPSAVGEIRDDGTIGTGRGLRPERFRAVFVKTLAACVRRAIAERERAVCEQVPQSATEFGPIEFPAAEVAEREATPGWGAKPEAEPPPAMTFDDFKQLAWECPKTPETVRLKKLVVDAFITKADWEKEIAELWEKEQKAK